MEYMIQTEGVGRCFKTNGGDFWALKDIGTADTLIVAGTSLTVYPAASYVRYFRGSNMVLINRDKTPYDKMADLVIHEKVGEVLSQL